MHSKSFMVAGVKDQRTLGGGVDASVDVMLLWKQLAFSNEEWERERESEGDVVESFLGIILCLNTCTIKESLKLFVLRLSLYRGQYCYSGTVSQFRCILFPPIIRPSSSFFTVIIYVCRRNVLNVTVISCCCWCCFCCCCLLSFWLPLISLLFVVVRSALEVTGIRMLLVSSRPVL